MYAQVRIASTLGGGGIFSVSCQFTILPFLGAAQLARNVPVDQGRGSCGGQLGWALLSARKRCWLNSR